MTSKQHQPKRAKPARKKGKNDALVEASTKFLMQEKVFQLNDEIILSLENTSSTINTQDLIQSELRAARLINVDLPDEPSECLALLESRIQEITGTQKNTILILDEESGTYRCLNDEQHTDLVHAPRELTWISDTYLQDLLESDNVIHSFLYHEDTILGIIAIADKANGKPFTVYDEIILEQLSQYLSVQVNHFLTLRRSRVLPTIQRILLGISNRLLAAVDATAIFEGALEAIHEELPFTAGQYIQLDRETGQGHVLFERQNDAFKQGTPLKTVERFASLLSLFQSQVWDHPYIYLKGELLGDQSFADLFGIPDTQSVIVLPLATEEGQIESALVLFQQGELQPLSKEALEVIEQIPELVMSAYSRAQVLEKALELAATDELTGCVNRRGFYEQFEAEVERARRNQSPICLAIIDIDHFKILNDTYGHLAGDAVLKELAGRIQENIRKSDIICRYGGEEFTLVLPETSLQDGLDLVERLRRKVAKKPFKTKSGNIKVTFSAGLTLVETSKKLFMDAADTMSSSLNKADEMLYEAKQLGRNRVLVAD